MVEKLKDEYDAMMICREKVVQRGLPMQIVDAEYQWDRRKLTFYFKAEKRVDFRELTKENFRIFKSRIWMSMVPKDDPRGGPTAPGAAPGPPTSAPPV
jgi:cell fate regulator YaaT (PSP1 superfamily)